ncbi:hypothetical protein GCM10009559_18160 [Pseudonocardia zijingensis]|uniref:Uncharacterized protein n=1 Tax=Pseudonocardia zijingensis TaxID=153376 RepID=A0ABN1PPC8_9PSEU
MRARQRAGDVDDPLAVGGDDPEAVVVEEGELHCVSSVRSDRGVNTDVTVWAAGSVSSR